MSTPLTDAINALTTYANSITEASDTDLSSAVATLAAGYGGGSSTSGSLTGDYMTVSWAVVTAGENSVSNVVQLKDYLLSLAGATGSPTIWFYSIIDEPETRYYNMILGVQLSSVKSSLANLKVYRYRNGTVSAVNGYTASYDAALEEGVKYIVVWATETTTPS